MAANYNQIVAEYVVSYKECLHNHTTQATGYVVDGCGLFTASGPNGTPEAMVCAACHCHRNFHKMVVVEVPPRFGTQGTNTTSPPPLPHPQTSTIRATSSTPSQPRDHQQTQSGDDVAQSPALQMQRPQTVRNSTRTRLTHQQYETLRSITERNNWKMFREYSREEVDRICLEIGIARARLKSWINHDRRKRMASNAIQSLN